MKTTRGVRAKFAELCPLLNLWSLSTYDHLGRVRHVTVTLMLIEYDGTVFHAALGRGDAPLCASPDLLIASVFAMTWRYLQGRLTFAFVLYHSVHAFN